MYIRSHGILRYISYRISYLIFIPFQPVYIKSHDILRYSKLQDRLPHFYPIPTSVHQKLWYTEIQQAIESVTSFHFYPIPISVHQKPWYTEVQQAIESVHSIFIPFQPVYIKKKPHHVFSCLGKCM